MSQPHPSAALGTEPIRTISRDELKSKLDRGDEFKLIMALNRWAFDAKHIPGSLHFDTPEELYAGVRSEDDVVVYCSHVDCLSSVALYRELVRRGYRDVRRYAGGLLDWEDKGLPLEGNMVVSHNRPDADVEAPPIGHPYATEIQAERGGWYELAELVRSLTPEVCLEPGYYSDPDWAVRDVVAHVGTWLAGAQVQFERINVGSYEGHDLDIDGLNATFLAAMSNQPWEIAWVQANAARSKMIRAWYDIEEPSDEAAWWITKSGSDHYAEHLARLREWVGELAARRNTRN